MTDWLIRKKIVEELKMKFYLEFLPGLVGRKFHAPRGYGHAEYIIHGGPETWRQGRDRHKAFITFANGKAEITRYDPDGVAIVIERLGGYNGSCSLPTLQETLDEFKVEEVTWNQIILYCL